MDFQNRRYSEDEVSAIVRRALQGRSSHGDITHDDLLNIAQQSGITRDQLERAIEEQETLAEYDEAKSEWTRRRREEFFGHLRSYLIVIFMLMLINLFTGRGYPWFLWPALGWGIGIAFHASDTFFVSKEKLERGAQRLLQKKMRKAKSDRRKEIFSEIIDNTIDSLSK
jgi:hypothetical protein